MEPMLLDLFLVRFFFFFFFCLSHVVAQAGYTSDFYCTLTL